MPNYEVECSDGSDPNCWGVFDYPVPIVGLTAAQLDDIFDGKEVLLNQKQIAANSLVLTENEIEDLKSDGVISRQYHVFRPVCGPCGSDQTHDEDGNNITSI